MSQKLGDRRLVALGAWPHDHRDAQHARGRVKRCRLPCRRTLGLRCARVPMLRQATPPAPAVAPPPVRARPPLPPTVDLAPGAPAADHNPGWRADRARLRARRQRHRAQEDADHRGRVGQGEPEGLDRRKDGVRVPQAPREALPQGPAVQRRRPPRDPGRWGRRRTAGSGWRTSGSACGAMRPPISPPRTTSNGSSSRPASASCIATMAWKNKTGATDRQPAAVLHARPGDGDPVGYVRSTRRPRRRRRQERDAQIRDAFVNTLVPVGANELARGAAQRREPSADDDDRRQRAGAAHPRADPAAPAGRPAGLRPHAGDARRLQDGRRRARAGPRRAGQHPHPGPAAGRTRPTTRTRSPTGSGSPTTATRSTR